MPSSTLPKTVYLASSSDWPLWFSVVKGLATDSGVDVWGYIDPTTKTATPLPTFKPFPKPTDVKPEATGIMDLKPEDMVKMKYLIDQTNNENSITTRVNRVLESISRFIVETVSTDNQKFIEKVDGLHNKLQTLKQHLSPTDEAEMWDSIEQFRALDNINRSEKIDAYLNRWERTYRTAVQNKIPDVQNNMPYYTLVRAFKNIDDSYGTTKGMEIRKKIQNNETLPTIYQEIEEFRHYRRIYNADKPSHSHSAFASFKGDKQQPNKRKSDKPLPLCLCEERHFARECPYLSKYARSADWKADKAVQELVNDKLKDLETRKRIDGYLRKAAEYREKHKETSNTTTETTTSSSEAHPSDMGAFPVALPPQGSAYSSASHYDYKLRSSWIYDSGATIHICNNTKGYILTREANAGDFVYAGTTTYPIESFGTVKIMVNTLEGKGIMTLLNVAYIPQFMTNLVSSTILYDKGVYWNMEKQLLYRTNPHRILCNVERVDNQWVLENNTLSIAAPAVRQAFAVQSHPMEASPEKWHRILGHAGSDPIENLQANVDGAKVAETGIQAPKTIDCEHCSQSKAKQIISRSSNVEYEGSDPFHRVAYDLIDMSTGYNGDEWVSHFRCFSTLTNYVYTHARKSQSTNIVKTFSNMVNTRFGHKIKYLRIDGETSLGKKFYAVIRDLGMTAERSAPYTPAQNGAAERSGGVIIVMARTMTIAASLPTDLWPEATKAAGYLLNRLPTRKLKWKTPFEALTKQKPNIGHLHPYGCRAYSLKHNIPKRQKLDARAHIGYLVGYDSTNIFRIWIPTLSRVIRTRDVTFNDNLYYSPFEIDAGELLQGELHQIELPQLPDSVLQDEEDPLEFSEQSTEYSQGPQATQTNAETATESVETAEMEKSAPTEEQMPALLTPRETPDPTTADANPTQITVEPASPQISSFTPAPDALLPETASAEGTHTEAAPRANEISGDFKESNIQPTRTRRRAAHAAAVKDTSSLSGYYAAFSAGIGQKKHQDTLPPEPKTWKQMLTHPYSKEFMDAATKEFTDLDRKGTFDHSPINGDEKVLPLIWVFKYKVDTDGYLLKFKARLCARGDLQLTEEETYAATLAAQTFRALMALVAAFDLETKHLDAVNAFVNGKLTEPIYCYYPEGFRRLGRMLILRRALYGLKTSPLLWYKEFTDALQDLGLFPVPGVNCLYSNGWLSLLFYVDDIILIYARKNEPRLRDFEAKLLQRYEMRQLGEVKWFLGIRIIRDREEQKLWLTQDSYISAMANKYNIKETRRPHTPLPSEKLVPFDGKATPGQIHAYQQRVGSINYTAVISRPDVARPVSKLSTFLRNPSPLHISAANRTISYLDHSRSLAIEFSAHSDMQKIFLGLSDAAFADNPDTQHSSCGYLFQLFGGPVHWKATKLNSVTTSTTEAELLSLSMTAREMTWWRRFFKSINFDTEQTTSLLCDNSQTIRLLQQDTPRLTTKLRHVDVHQCWLREQVQNKRLNVEWIPSAKMIADGLTKELTRQQHESFVKQLNLVDIKDRISAGDLPAHSDSDSEPPGGVCQPI